MIAGETRCCGVLEIDGLSSHETPRAAMTSLIDRLRNRCTTMPVPFITFVGVVAYGKDESALDHARVRRFNNYGQEFADYIVQNDLGNVVESNVRASWSGNTLKMWIWEPDYFNLWDHLDELERERVEPYR